jgi:ribosome-associated translation inhibitor RaiA
MKHELEFKNFEPAPEIRKRIGNGIARLERKLRGLGQDPLFLRSVVEEVSVHKRFRVIVTLVVPHKTLAAKEETHDAEAAIRAAFTELEKQLAAYKSTLRGEQWWKRVQRRLELKRQRAGVSPPALSRAGAMPASASH